jgi:hypothetical protein
VIGWVITPMPSTSSILGTAQITMTSVKACDDDHGQSNHAHRSPCTDRRQWPVQVNYLLFVGNATGVCGLKVVIDGIQHATSWWPAWVGEGTYEGYLGPGAVSCSVIGGGDGRRGGGQWW